MLFFAILAASREIAFVVALVLLAIPAFAGDWKIEPGTEVAGEYGWVWRLESVEQSGSELAFTLQLRNTSHATRGIALPPDYPSYTALADENGSETPVRDIGRADKAQRVKPGKAATVRLVFERPSGERALTLRATWRVTQDMAADRWLRMALPVTLPE